MKIEDCWYKNVCNNTCSNSCVRYLEMVNLLKLSTIPENKWFPVSMSPDDCDYNAFCELADIKDNIESFVDAGKNLYIYSNETGNGKTTWSIKLMLSYFNKVWAGNGFRCRGLFINVPTFLNRLKNFNSIDIELDRIKNDLVDADLVIWDDIASTDMSSYDNSQLLNYIDSRILNNKSNIFTSNLGGNQLDKALGIRLSSRVWNTSKTIKLSGRDNR